ncbi:hypothetical protein N5C43_08840 [Comamonas terrigena]|uniref:ECs_2282 family putative zinc-binding protein n=1 Tax=Comamonas terrigena TaxID=32013 RepID=UPI00244BE988|nr:hypothetical protein [Comamonas terrigena]MDH1291364.1 hypothetical protein [Comamonas terrigena]
MDADKYLRTIQMLCPTCGSNQFSAVENESSDLVTCASCGRILTRDELLRENSENIAEHVEEVKAQVAKDISKQLHDSLRKAFKGNKSIRVK